MKLVSASIDLAHEQAFALGELCVRPSTREVVAADRVEVLEPRVMQVLVALHRAGGAIVSRDDLSHCCWEGRVVGDDAINRVISRLRRTAEGIGRGSFRVETVTKVGYRLVSGGGERPAVPDQPPLPPATPQTRRAMMAGLGAGAAALAGGAWLLRQRDDAPPAAVAELMERGELALRQVTSDGNAQALALFEQVTEIAPDYADGWGHLALVCALESHARSASSQATMQARAVAAIERALALDPRNAPANGARAMLLPARGRWLEIERILRGVLRDHPTNAD